MSKNGSPRPENHVIVLFGATGDLARDASSSDEGSNGYGSDLRLGGNCRREVDHFRYVLASSSRT